MIGLSLLTAPRHAQAADSGFAHTSGQQIVDGNGQPLYLRGINLGNWFETEGYMFHFEHGPQSTREIEALTNELLGPDASARFWHEWREKYITRDDIAYLHQIGLNSIRIPIDYRYFTPGNDEGFRLLDRVIGWAGENHIYVVIDMHAAPCGQTGTNIDNSWGYPWLYDSEECQRQTVEIWTRIAAHYTNNKTVLGYDLLNEPVPHYPSLQKYNDKLEPVYKKIVAGIRTVDKHHIVILGGAQWDTNFKVFGPPFDTNTVYQLHKYWMDPVQASIQTYVDFSKQYNVPVWLGESGENNDAWIGKFVTVLEQNHIGWAFWTYKKIDTTSSIVSAPKPRYWDEIVAYSQLPEGTGNAEKRIGARPPQDHIQAAFDDLLKNVEFANCVKNPGYIQALGLKEQ
ncbi:glycoside hydrolase family 5 protein [Silvibacterium dinghuense]|uniref:Glycoside hydrolase family 5 protein n=1 Tax=Silvibacterium dinghuense TaxID=1560006 RepID=A0A4Q1SL01_9BACT|nr:glycoside hydrolase family 5 protein [Silvibacterium dinghuense]